jgi:lipopolysaccharide transport system permease protein
MKTIIDAKKNIISIDLKELFAYKDLFVLMAYRDLRVRYAQTALGVIWIVLQPIMNLVIFTFIFNKVVKVDSGGIPYPVFALSGMAAWSYFAFLCTQSGNSLVGNQNLIKKVFFPRIIIPAGKALVGLVDFAIFIVLLVIVMIYYGQTPGKEIVFLPIFIGLNLLFGVGVGIWLSALTIRYRDFHNIATFLVQIGIYATPIYYPQSVIPEKYQVIAHLNPMAGIVEGFRWSLTGVYPPPVFAYYSFLWIPFILITGLAYFSKVEKTMADLI